MSEPKRAKDKDGEKERREARMRIWWSSRRELKKDKGAKMESPSYKYPEHPDQDDGFYGHYLPSHFKKTSVIRSYGKA